MVTLNNNRYTQLIKILSELKSPQEAAHLLNDLLTPKEADTLLRRLKIADLLVRGQDYEDIQSELKVGFSTIAKVNSWLHQSGSEIKKLLSDQDFQLKLLILGGTLVSSYAVSNVSDSDGFLTLGLTIPMISQNYIKRGGENMKKKLIGVGIGAALLMSVAVPAFAQDGNSSSAGSTIKACNQTYQSAVKDIRAKVKAGTLKQVDAKVQMKTALTTKNTCIKDAQSAAKAAAKAKMEAKKAEMKAKSDAARAAAKAKMEAAKEKAAAARKTTKTNK